MSSIGRTHHLRCQHPGCTKRRPYWSDFCKAHRRSPEASPRETESTAIEPCVLVSATPRQAHHQLPRLHDARAHAGRIARAVGRELVQTFSVRTRAKGQALAQARADARAQAQATAKQARAGKRALAWALAHAQRQATRAIARARAHALRKANAVVWHRAKAKAKRAQAHAEAAAGAVAEVKLIEHARARFDQALTNTRRPT